MKREGLAVVLLPAVVALVLAAPGMVVAAPLGFAARTPPALMSSRSPDFRAAVAAATQDSPVVEASLRLDRPARRLIQQGLRNEGFDPGTPDGLFGPRTRKAIRDWQSATGRFPSGYLDDAEAGLLRAAGAPRSVAPVLAESVAPPVTEDDPEPDPPPNSSRATPRYPAAVEPHAADEAAPVSRAGSSRATNAPATRATGTGQLPPDIMLDSYLLRAEQSVRDDDRAGAGATMERIDALEAEHELETAPDYHYRYARIWNAVGNWERGHASALRYVELTGREGEHYLDALTLLNRATAALEEIEIERERRAADEARARAAEERARAETERALNGARGVLAEMEFVRIPAGQFRMGASKNVTPWMPVHRPVSYFRRREVRITRPFAIGRYEITQSEWEAVMGSNPSGGRRECAHCPVGWVEWDDVQRFVAILNSASGNAHVYRLPTEAEWEYAARAGNNDERFGRPDLEESAWYEDNSGDEIHPVGLKRPNGFGLYDMIGNVEEWVQDWYGYYPGDTRVDDPTGPRSYQGTSRSPERVVRGCSYRSGRQGCEIGYRTGFPHDNSRWHIGFRLVRTVR